jgi:hypothetical protein
MAQEKQFEFTAEHRAAAASAHATGRVAVIDRGPPPPKAAEGKPDPEAEKARMAAAQREHDDWHKLHDAPVMVAMPKVDADHAVLADPERYIQVPRAARPPVTVEERLTQIERRLGPIAAEEENKIRERDDNLARERAKALAPKPTAPKPEPWQP